MNKHALTKNWFTSTTQDQVILKRRFKFCSPETADAFVKMTGSYLSTPRLSLAIEPILETAEVACILHCKLDDILIHSAKQMALSLDTLYTYGSFEDIAA